MTDPKKELRKKAEKLIGRLSEEELAAAPESIQKLVHELHVHQIELELQNQELQKAETAASKARQRYFELYDMAPVAYLTLERDGEIRQANLTACALLGVSRERIGGKPKIRLAYYLEGPPDYYALDESLRKALTSNKRQTCELQLHKRRTGRRGDFFVHADFFPADNRSEDDPLVLVTLTDISQRKKAELALQKANAELKAAKDRLEDRVRERTEELENSNFELRRAVDALSELNKELQDFSFAASHDLQEPLRKIQVFGNLLVDGYAEKIEDRGRDYLARMQNAAERMQFMLKGLLSYSRVTTQSEPYKEVDLNETLGRVLSSLQLVVEKSGAKITFKDLPAVKGDSSQLESLFQNLIENALKYRNEKTPPAIVIKGESHKLKKGGSVEEWAKIEVADNGIGFDTRYLDRIFVPFQRLHGRSEYEGNGMGLAICKKIVERHGGKITAESTPGKGSTFIVRLPVG